jgi:lysophospholipase L1-like esterase
MDGPVAEGLNTSSSPTKLRRLVIRVKYLLPRLLLSCVVFVIVLRLADVLWGTFNHSSQRYLLHLNPNFRQRHNSSEFDYEFRTNSLGLRGPEIPFQKPHDVTRIVVLGDSFVAGNGVAEAETFPAQLQGLLNGPISKDSNLPRTSQQRTEVINVGCTGISTIRALDLYEILGKRFQPNLVILAYYVGNDLTGVVNEQTQAEFADWKPQGLLRRVAYAVSPNLYLEWKLRRPAINVMGQILRDQTQAAFPNALRDLATSSGYDGDLVLKRYQAIPAEIRRRIELGQLSEHRVLLACLDPAAQRQAIFPTAEFFSVAWPRTVDHLNQLRATAERDAATFVLVVIPTACQIDRQALEFNRKLGYEVDPTWLTEPCTTTKALMQWARSEGVAALDLTEPFRRSREKLYFTEDTHLTPAGQLKLAELLKEFLRQHNLPTTPK